ncbi:cupin domain-containing protein [Arthrobacter sp. FW306-04-A]|uniref:cupin domain-containing protein n=1 Tax=Arthrobacter sp. FW306-04-A TaxID=2879619 RepID=UPI0037C04713|nr:cupin domain-containing protein [Arthrobacter sp. FW306-04-A]
MSLSPDWGKTDATIGLHGGTVNGGSTGRKSIVIYFRIEPGKRTGRHTDSAEEVIYIVEGLVEARVGDERALLVAGSIVVIPPGVIHDITNAGESPVTAIGFFSEDRVDSVFEEPLLPRDTDTFSLP